MKKEIFNEMLRTGEFERMFEQNKINELLNSGDLDKKQIDVLINIGRKLSKEELQKRQHDIAKQPGYKEYILTPLISKVIAQQNRVRDPETGRYIKKDDKPKVSKETQETALQIDSTLSKNTPKEEAAQAGVTTTEATNKDSNVKRTKKKTIKDAFVAPKMQVNKAFYATVIQKSSRLQKGDSAANIAAKLFLFLSRVGMDKKKLIKDEEKKKMTDGYSTRSAVKEEKKTSNFGAGAGVFKAALLGAVGVGGMYFIENMDKFTGIKEMQSKLEDFSGGLLKQFKNSEMFKKIESVTESIKKDVIAGKNKITGKDKNTGKATKQNNVDDGEETIIKGTEKIIEDSELGLENKEEVVVSRKETETELFDMDKYMQATKDRESYGGVYNLFGKSRLDDSAAGKLNKRQVQVNTGFIGAYQMGSEALEDLGFLKPGTTARGSGYKKTGPDAAVFHPETWKVGSLKTFLNDPGMQDEAMRRLTKSGLANLKRIGVTDKNTSAVEMSRKLAVFHHGGMGAVLKYQKNIPVKDRFLATDTFKTANKMEKDYSSYVKGKEFPKDPKAPPVRPLPPRLKMRVVENDDGTKMEKDSRPVVERKIVVQPYVEKTNTTVFVHDPESGDSRAAQLANARQKILQKNAERLSNMIPPSLRKQHRDDQNK